jgi:hypothetical protein
MIAEGLNNQQIRLVEKGEFMLHTHNNEMNSFLLLKDS